MNNKLAIAGKQLLKGNFGNAFTALAMKSITSQLIQPARYRNGNFFFGINGGDKAFIWGNFNSSLIAYQQCPVVSSVINRKALCLINGKRVINNVKGKEDKSPQGIAIRNLLNRPNPLQNGKQFRAQGNVYKEIYGYCPVLKMVPVGFEEDFSKWTLWNVPPWMIQITDSQDLFFMDGVKPFKQIRLTYMGNSVDVTDKIFFLKENQISTSIFMSNGSQDNVSLFLPDSRLFPLQESIANLISSLKSRGSLIRKRGPLWILSNDSNDAGGEGLFPVDPKVEEKLQADWLMHGIADDQKKAIVTDAKLKLQTVGFDVAQLKLLEGEVQDAKLICDGLDFPPYLLGLVDSKFDNQQIAERNLYTNAIIPMAESEDEQWGEVFNALQYGIVISTDFSHIAALQENITEQGRGRWYMNQALQIEFVNDLLTWNEWRTALSQDTVAGMDLYYSQLVAAGRIVPAPVAAGGPNVSNDSQNNNSSSSNSNGNGNGN